MTFAMGYFFTNIGYKRERKLSIIREKFEKLYHPFYMLIQELGTEREDGFALDSDNLDTLKPFFDHLISNVYLASSEGQRIFWETRQWYILCHKSEATPEWEEALGKGIGDLFSHLFEEYLACARTLGYDLAFGWYGARTEEDSDAQEQS
ncbi:MAG: hypothetical protein LBG99_03415 [Propionibacteriaceae bacterium]|nr:hypothetical protein [Propionibacteriaceae bacterium]